ncbi:hypothetical protein KDH_17530 [Dictyobacter sp. S3.2.2.5]|uniref:Potassium channel domain-containing protein n=1 Tax=Dictyobacter halimunensis TaxID=3026934 RepID=A0ABQ6FKR5_9CHLR|nr:hypothetical protein KDH_17030 [Dictyobacter sp. S3.2.2.5]GLV54906.1 hypothetical protein KDH_17530 [Dictyobacter sp. S3.2.2.5]
MRIIAIIIGILLIVVIAQDGFETVVLPRRVARKFRLARLFYSATWQLWSALARKMRPNGRRGQYLSYYGPLSLLLLLAVWASGFVFSFALLQWGLASPLHSPDTSISFATYVYMSGTTFVTLGLGDVIPLSSMGRGLVAIEAGFGLAFLALIIGYLPVIYQAFSRRETNITLLDARAGSPPTALELLRRHSHSHFPDELLQFMRDWEKWCAELLESHISYPVLTYYRSQHERQSWLAALTTVLDAGALALVGIEQLPVKPMKFTFAIARHAAVDLAQTYGTPPTRDGKRLSSEDFIALREQLAEAGLVFTNEETAERRLAEIRSTYEPFLVSLSEHLLIPLPDWIQRGERVDDWQTSAWDHFLPSTPSTIDHAMRGD